jgi:hypothetical protein
MLLAILGSLVSGIILSQEVFAIVSLTGLTAFARTCHLLAAYWGFALISMHVGLHWGLILGMIKKGTGLKKIPSAAVWGLRLLGLMSVLLGARAFLKYNLWGYMSRQIQFVFFDLEQPLFAFFCNYFFMLTMWAWIASYLKKLSENFTRKEDRKSKLKIIFESFLG